MRQRAYIHITGPIGGGKTTLIERLLEFSSSILIAARCTARDDVQDFIEARDGNDAELARYRKAGASAVMRYRFESGLEETDALWVTDFMQQYSEGVLFEGDMPARVGDLTVYVARPLPARKPLLRHTLVDQTTIHEQEMRFLEGLTERSNGIEDFAALMFGNPDVATRMSQEFRVAWVSEMRALTEKVRAAGPRPPEKRWVLAEGLEGIETAEVVAVNVSTLKERKRADTMVEELQRLRKDKDVFKDIVGHRGSRSPILARVVDLTDTGDKNMKSLLRRIERTISAESQSR